MVKVQYCWVAVPLPTDVTHYGGTVCDAVDASCKQPSRPSGENQVLFVQLYCHTFRPCYGAAC